MGLAAVARVMSSHTQSLRGSLRLLSVLGACSLSCVAACDDDDGGDDTHYPGTGGNGPYEPDGAPPNPPPPDTSERDAALPEPEPETFDGGSTPGPAEAGTGGSGGVRDAGALDAGLDSGSTDSGLADAGIGDAGLFIPDAGVLRPVELPFREEYLERLKLPPGFEIDVYAMPGGQTRMLALHGEALYVTRPTQGDVLRLVDEDGDGAAETESTALAGRPMVHGIAFVADEVYLATPTELLHARVDEDGSFTDVEVLADDLPEGGQHALRTLGIGPDGLVYESVGSSCDSCEETNPEHATLLRFAGDFQSRALFATGLRNTIGFAWHPGTAELWGMDHGADWRGNDVPPEELNLLIEGKDYGWPYCYGEREVDPIVADPPGQSKEEYCADTEPATFSWQAHEAPIGLTFYSGEAFPPGYKGDAFAAMHGSWNRVPATGYSVVRIDFMGGAPVDMVDFVDGFLAEDGLSTFGRPAGITAHPDGSLLFSDDSNGVIYRVSRDAANDADAG